jgi:hypothetical protein
MATITVPFSLRSRSLVTAGMLALVPACGTQVELLAAAGTTGGPTTGVGSTGSGGSPMGAPGSVRFAHLSTQLGPFDVCADTTLFAQDGLAAGLQFGEVSRYYPPPEPHGAPWMLVSPSGGSCWDPAAVAIPVVVPPGAEGARVTIVPWRTVVGGEEQTTFFTYVDERVNDHYGIDLRALSFIDGPMVSVLQQGPGEPQAAVLFSMLAFTEVGTHSDLGEVTPDGFVHTPYVGVSDLDIVPDAYVADVVMPGDVPVPGGDGNAYGIGSIFLAGGIDDGSMRAVVCADDSPPDGARSACTVLSPKTP